MGILDDDVARVRESTDLVALVGEHVALKRVGARYTGLCPFHAEKTASFSVNPSLGLYYCFGCQKSGDAITFVRDVEGLNFVDAVERLAARAGITLRYDNAATGKDRQKKQRLTEAVGAAIDFYHRRLLEAPDAGRARQYLRSRGFEGDAVRRFVLGWAPDDFDQLSRHLQQAKFARDDIVNAGLAFVNRANRLQDQFRNRLLFPIYDGKGDPAGFGGRILDGDGPKYKNSPETPIYQKSRLLYGLNWAKAEIVARGEVIICEGYTDVMAFALSGAPNAVATCGTALADDHFQILKNLARKVTLAYDADAAGQGAAEKWYGWEQRYEIELRVADLPPGRDPGDLWRDDRPALAKALGGARPFLQFRVDRLLSSADRSTSEARARVARQALAIVNQHPNPIVRSTYIGRLSEELSIERQFFERELVSSRRFDALDTRIIRPQETVDRRELDVLRWTVHRPEQVHEWLEPRLFTDPTARSAAELLVSHDDFRSALDASTDDVRALLERLAVEEPIEGNDPIAAQTLLMVDTVEPAARRVRAALLEAGDERSMEVTALLDELVAARSASEWERARLAAKQLVGWLAEREGPTAPD